MLYAADNISAVIFMNLHFIYINETYNHIIGL